MTRAEAVAEQERIGRLYNLGWYYGTNCEKCCGVYPRFHDIGSNARDSVYYQCDVCGKRTPAFSMPYLAEEAWNRGEWLTHQTRLEL